MCSDTTFMGGDFYLRIVSKLPVEMSTPIGTVLELRSHVNLPCLVNMAYVIIFYLALHDEQ